jgi:hypothetical protein
MSAPQEEQSAQEVEPEQGPVQAVEAAALDGDLGTGGNLEKIRNILFGAQSREYDRRFARVEERLAKEASDIRDDLRRAFEALDAKLQRALETVDDRFRAEETERSAATRELAANLKDTNRSLQERIKNEQSDRVDAVKELTGELRDAANSIDRRLNQLNEQTQKANRELRDALGDQARAQSDDLRHKTEELWAALSRSVEDLRSEKTDRASLAAMLNELAMRLTDEFKIPSEG